MNVLCLDGKFITAEEPVLYSDNRGFRYGDALFETMRMINGEIPLSLYHFDRLFSGISLLQYKIPVLFNKELLTDKAKELCKKNKCESSARIRLTVFRGNGGLYDENKNIGYLIECWPFDSATAEWNENGLIIDIFPDAAKSCDKFSNLKSASFLIYSMAALYAKQHLLNECLVLNTKGNIADGSITNLFIIKAGTIFTPSLDEGCVGGVMRKFIIESLRETGYAVKETAITIHDLLYADEVFLTNAVKGIKWVSSFRDKTYSNTQTKKIYTTPSPSGEGWGEAKG